MVDQLPTDIIKFLYKEYLLLHNRTKFAFRQVSKTCANSTRMTLFAHTFPEKLKLPYSDENYKFLKEIDFQNQTQIRHFSKLWTVGKKRSWFSQLFRWLIDINTGEPTFCPNRKSSIFTEITQTITKINKLFERITSQPNHSYTKYLTDILDGVSALENANDPYPNELLTAVYNFYTYSKKAVDELNVQPQQELLLIYLKDFIAGLNEFYHHLIALNPTQGSDYLRGQMT